MAKSRIFALKVPRIAECIVSVTSPGYLSFSVYCEDSYYSFEDEKVPLGQFLCELGLTIEDCGRAIAEWRACGEVAEDEQRPFPRTEDYGDAHCGSDTTPNSG